MNEVDLVSNERLASEILFNRAMVWLSISFSAFGCGHRTYALLALVPCFANMWRSYRLYDG